MQFFIFSSDVPARKSKLIFHRYLDPDDTSVSRCFTVLSSPTTCHYAGRSADILCGFYTSSHVNYKTPVIVTWSIYIYFSGQAIHSATMATSTSLSSDCIDPYSGSHGYSLLSFSCDAVSVTKALLLQADFSQQHCCQTQRCF